MKCLFLLLTALYTQLSFAESFLDSYIRENRGKFTYPKNQMALKEHSFERKLELNRTIALKLGSIKYEMINGNLEKAKVLLLQSKYTDNYSQNVQFRYMGIIHFIEGNYKKSQEFLTQKSMYNLSTDDSICLLRTLNYVILNSMTKANIEWKRCLDVTVNKSKTSHVWMSTILKLKLNDEPRITSVPLRNINIENERGDYLRLFLKMALYLNQQDRVFERLPFLSSAAYQDPELRELIGMLYYREGKLVKAYEFIEDLSSPNSENIKGNLYLAQNKYELAYAQFKLALKRKVNSQNSIERIIPVAWILKQWKDGLEFITKLDVDPKDHYKKLTIEAAFLSQDNQHVQAQAVLKQIVNKSNDSQRPEVNQLFSYNSIMLKDKHNSEKYAEKSCGFKDGINCWLRFHLTLWEHFPLMIHRDDKVFAESTNLVAEYSNSYTKSPLVEEVYVNQKDIEELDNDIIQLLPVYTK